MRRLARAAVRTTALVMAAGLVALPHAPVEGPAAATTAPLAGRTIVIDPGHQLGNHNFPDETARPVDAGGFQKACNTTGTATNGGYPEATFAWQVSLLLKARLEDRGARVILTRSTNREDRWGPCIDARGRRGNTLATGGRADLEISLHGDGCVGCGSGFHVIAPQSRTGWTDDIAASSLAFARTLRSRLHQAGLPYAPYVNGGSGLDVRGDLGTLNWSDKPIAMVELGNMRARADAYRMTHRSGRRLYADALTAAIVARLT
ncbi:N-acetylmuramoyl-L-alanine amidase family protein [Nocardioides jiangxiensis]|uniref:N-acetylmuramoyl-L-alanine amidase n=1 Tax=Nocardioides jiangxiensis TaxID=3064524 RepID=A0ABT9B082_9ACTN|nr:N-acetylmuramoyl-L-alanine amidase [Nocardioides sp. WY-20]MDO7867810.1 N-acetylmuramoyl-L-alanine amidase [Nocardioides sp. WY-20]